MSRAAPSRFADWTADNVRWTKPPHAGRDLAHHLLEKSSIRAALWKEASRPFDLAERRTKAALLTAWAHQYNSLVADLPSLKTNVEVAGVILGRSESLVGAALRGSLRPAMREHVRRSYRLALPGRRLKQAANGYDPDTYLQSKAFGAHIAKINATTRERVATKLAAAVADDSPLDEIERALASVLKSVERAVVVARTEVLGALNDAAVAGYSAAGAQFKEWVTSRDPFVRDAHAEVDGQQVPIDDPFVLDSPSEGEAEMMYPGDPDGPADLVINCRCISVPAFPGEDL